MLMRESTRLDLLRLHSALEETKEKAALEEAERALALDVEANALSRQAKEMAKRYADEPTEENLRLLHQAKQRLDGCKAALFYFEKLAKYRSVLDKINSLLPQIGGLCFE